jgi:hypothetical protein
VKIFQTQWNSVGPQTRLGDGEPSIDAVAIAVKDILEVGVTQEMFIACGENSGYKRPYFKVKTSLGEHICFFEVKEREDLAFPNPMFSAHCTANLKRDLIIAWGKALEESKS